jgi:hypothetical protein
MDYEQLKEEVKQIADLAASVPEQFREKCFELLLNNLIGKQAPTKNAAPSPPVSEEKKEDDQDDGNPSSDSLAKSGSSTIPMTTQLRLLMRKTTVTKEELEKVLMYDSKDGGNVHFVREPHDVDVTTGQIEWSLLLALKNVILKDSLSVDPEDVRSVCQEKGFYGAANFAANFKRPSYSKLYKGAMVKQGEAQQLTNDGQEALGKLIKRLAGESQ